MSDNSELNLGGATPTAPGTDTPANTPAANDGAARRIGELNAENAQRRHQNRELEAQLNDLRQQLTGIDELRQQLQAMQQTVQQAEQARLAAERTARVTQVAARYNLPPLLAERLQGSTLEEIERDAQQIAQALPGAVNARLSQLPTGASGTGGGADLTKQILNRARSVGGESPYFDVAFHQARGGSGGKE